MSAKATRAGFAETLTHLASMPTPAPHSPGTHPLWTDPHVSSGMLQAHLDPARDEASRRVETIDATVGWLTRLLPAGARVLDLGCGPGLYAERLATAGFHVTGVDQSARSIDYACSRPTLVRYLCADYRDVALDESFDAVLLIYLDYGALSPEDGHHMLARVRRWLAPEGRFVFDVATPVLRRASEQRRSWGAADAGFWADRPHLWLTRTVRYDDGPTYLDEHVVITADETRIYRVWERCFTPKTIRAELATAGLRPRTLHGDLAGGAYLAGSSRVIGVVASA